MTPVENTLRNAFAGAKPVPEVVPAERALDHAYALTIATSVESVKGFASHWDTWPHEIETDLNYFLHSLAIDSTIVNPYVITIFEYGVAKAMLVGKIRQQVMSATVSFIRVPGPKVMVLEIVGRGRLGEQGPAIDQLLASTLLEVVNRGGVDLLCFPRLALDSELFRQIRGSRRWVARLQVPHIFGYTRLQLSHPVDKGPRALTGKNERENRRKRRLVDRELAGSLRFQCFSTPDEVDAGLSNVSEVALKTWQHHLKDGFVRTSETDAHLRFCAGQGWLRIYVIYIDKVPRAFLLGQLHQGTFHCQHAGYDPKFSRFSLGSLLTFWVLEQLKAQGVKDVDLGVGDQEHNRRLGCEIAPEGTVHFYGKTSAGLCASAFVASTHAIRAGGRNALGVHLLNRLRPMWRECWTLWWKLRSMDIYPTPNRPPDHHRSA